MMLSFAKSILKSIRVLVCTNIAISNIKRYHYRAYFTIIGKADNMVVRVYFGILSPPVLTHSGVLSIFRIAFLIPGDKVSR